MSLRELHFVVLERDVPEHGFRRGDLGAVVHVHSHATLEVEFIRASGATQALVKLAATDVRPVADADLPSVRSVEPRRGEQPGT